MAKIIIITEKFCSALSAYIPDYCCKTYELVSTNNHVGLSFLSFFHGFHINVNLIIKVIHKLRSQKENEKNMTEIVGCYRNIASVLFMCNIKMIALGKIVHDYIQSALIVGSYRLNIANF